MPVANQRGERSRPVRVLALTAAFFSGSFASAQYGIAPSGYYPPNYRGSTFTGVVTEASDYQITLTQDVKGKVESFTGGLEMGCSVPRSDGSSRKMMAPEVPRSTQITVYFNIVTKGSGDKKVKENQIFGMVFNEYQGKPIPKENRKLFNCTGAAYRTFMAF